ncbi:hypothetical protein [Carboxylicivirga marina]|uniref:Uncharacterized protein n=1 Tax=Carboxylicivirga marina TaxID=2800988 RepID=A0ABS1HHB4_9BACT|nr:hypothetical protein [Carboxylicivirga marina]MBK3516673.1 hypothetical protein [Carboxylicivirga marina]
MAQEICLTQEICLSASEMIEASGIIINAILAYWIVRTIQDKLTNKRVLKDHFIEEIKEIRETYREKLKVLYTGNARPKGLLPWFKLMNIKIEDLLKLAHDKYQIDTSTLRPFQVELLEIVTENEDYEKNFRDNNKIEYSEVVKTEIMQFQQNNNHIFNELIIKINDSN